jgi:hypothetical protein
MSLEALVGGKTSIFIWLPCSSSDFHIWQLFPSPRCLWQVQQLEGLLGQPNGSCKSWKPPKLLGRFYGGPGTVEEGGDEEEKQGTKGMMYTFTCFSRPSASHPLVILGSWNKSLQETSVMCNIFVLRAIHSSIGHLLC